MAEEKRGLRAEGAMTFPPIITLEFMRRYLLAMGWMAPNQPGNPHAAWLRPAPRSMDVQGISDVLVRAAGQALIERLAYLEGCYPHIVAAHLALCAAADIAFCEADALRAAGHSAAADGAAAVAHALLGRAGIDLERWSEADPGRSVPVLPLAQDSPRGGSLVPHDLHGQDD